MVRSQKNLVVSLLLITFLMSSIYLYANIESGSRSDENFKKAAQVNEIQKEIEAITSELRKNEEVIKKLQTQLDEEHKLKEKKKIAKENEVYDEKVEADAAMEKNVDQLEGDADHKAVDEEKGGEVGDIPLKETEEKHVAPEPQSGNKVAAVHNLLKKTTISGSAANDVCVPLKNFSHTQSDVQMLDVYKILEFDNPDGGVWKQGWEIKYDESKVSSSKRLEVIVIPHSHCDPGWIKTFDKYYEDQVVGILGGMLKHLNEKKDMKFIYAEMSFMERWWRSITEQDREKVRSYLKSGQFEIVTGGWVMTDEANAHYFSIITELLEGHEWIRNHIGNDFRPKSHWSIDPFGYSPTLPHILSAANITNAALQRVHYSIKKHLAKNKQLEFMWRQLWGSAGQADVRTHVFPFYSYDVPHTCGPEPRVCCQFDFKRLPGGGDSCPWNVPPQRINSGNVAQRSFMIYDQYRKKSELYKTNILLIPLGDDFRYASDFEWTEQYENYKQLFEYMNNHKEWNVHARFGTLSDYFNSLGEALEEDKSTLPVFSGDLFTYADRDDHYWSGYFTSRPFYKQMDRVLQHYLRSAEIAYSIASMKSATPIPDFNKLVSARRALSLFQHHDGVTGTAKDHVVIDYGNKMIDALRNCEEILNLSLQSLLSSDKGSWRMFEKRNMQTDLPTEEVFSIGQSVVVMNTLSRPRTDPVCITVTSIDARVEGKKDLVQQISPVIFSTGGKLVVQPDRFELCFSTVVPPFGVESYKIVAADAADLVTKATIMSKNSIDSEFKFISLSGDVTLDNGLIKAVFDVDSGFVKSVTPIDSSVVEINACFVSYGARGHKQNHNGGGDDLSGAYLFLPNGEATSLPVSGHDIIVIDGPIVKRVVVLGHSDVNLRHTATIYKGSHYVDLENEIDIRGKSNFELAMRLSTNVKSGENLFTDLNGMQMIRRRRMLDKLPLQAHFYPMPANAYIEDTSTRLSLLGSQALGVASLKEGQIEVMLDRRLNQDDGRGLFQGVLDNRRTLSHFRLLVEPLSKPVEDSEATVGFHSPVAFSVSMELHYPWIKMISESSLSAQSVTGIADSLSCDTHIVTLRTSASKTDYNSPDLDVSPMRESALILHRPLLDCRSKLKLDNECLSKKHQVSPKSLFNSIKSVHNASLTLLYDGAAVETVDLQPQEVRTVRITY